MQQIQQLSAKNSDFLSIIEISDLHLFDDNSRLYNNINPNENLTQILEIIRHNHLDSDLLAITGDLLQEPNTENYDKLFARFATLGLPFVAIAGNHDVTLELDSHLPFFQRRHVAVEPDSRLVDCHVIDSEYWQLLFLDSSTSGKISGHFSEKTLNWLHDTLQNSTKNCAIFAHHPMLKINSAWIDQHWLTNSDEFWQTVSPFADKLKAIFVGHVHQNQHFVRHNISLYTCPATSVQFKPNCDDYMLDDLSAGFRWIKLLNNGTVETDVIRL